MPALHNAAPLAGLALRCQSDSRLVGLSREGQPRAFEEIVRRYRQPLVSFAGAIVPADRAEDVVQEALAKAHATLAASQAEVKLKPWLYTIVRNRALNDLRDEPIHEHLDENFDGVPQPPEVAARREQLGALIAQVRDLPPVQRDALVQRELEGRSHREIGVALGVTPGAVRGLIFRARTALRDGAGMLIPIPALRALLNAGPLGAEATGTAVGGAAVGLTAGGGGGIAIKAGTTLAIAVLAIGSGVAIQDRGGSGRDRDATAFASNGDAGAGGGAGNQGAGGSSGRSGHGSGSASDPGSGPGGDSGHGSDDSDGSGRGDGGDDDSGDDDRSDGGDGEGHEGPGGGEEEHGGGGDSEDSGGHEGPGGGEEEHEGSDSEDSGSEESGDGSSSGSDSETDADSSDDEALSTDE